RTLPSGPATSDLSRGPSYFWSKVPKPERSQTPITPNPRKRTSMEAHRKFRLYASFLLVRYSTNPPTYTGMTNKTLKTGSAIPQREELSFGSKDTNRGSCCNARCAGRRGPLTTALPESRSPNYQCPPPSSSPVDTKGDAGKLQLV
ncbi:hypothetical protein H1C71_028580, partial [Ictidomys tridecemlineatus]